MKTRKDLDGRSEDVETHRTCQTRLEILDLLVEEVGVGRLRGRGLRGGRKGEEVINTSPTHHQRGQVSGLLSFGSSATARVFKRGKRGQEGKETHRGHGGLGLGSKGKDEKDGFRGRRF